MLKYGTRAHKIAIDTSKSAPPAAIFALNSITAAESMQINHADALFFWHRCIICTSGGDQVVSENQKPGKLPAWLADPDCTLYVVTQDNNFLLYIESDPGNIFVSLPQKAGQGV